MPLVSGATAAGFNIVRLLGCGQIGELYLAEQPRLPRQYALKILPADVSADPEYRFRFNQESDRAAALWHPNIVGLHDRGEFEDRLWVAMDYVDGTDAAHLLTDTYPEGMPPDMVIEIVSAIADALDYAHEQGLVHRYVNPSNILISNSASGRRRILLTGFGVPRPPGQINTLTRANLAIGTVSYAAPEQLMDDSVDGQADQYALACTAFHLLTGWPPFAHMNPAVVVSKHFNDATPRPSDVKPELIYFDAPFARALMKAPAERFPRCRDFAKALEARGKLKSIIPNAKAASPLTASGTNNMVPTEPAVPPDTEVGKTAATPEALPEPEVHDVAAPPDVEPETEVDDAIALAEPDVRSAAADDASNASRRRRPLHATALGLAVLAVALGGILGVIALRSASKTDDTPGNVDTLSPVTTTPPARPAPATAIPPPIVKAPAPRTTTARTATASPAATTTPTASSSSVAQTTAPHTTTSHPPTTTPSGLDLRPAVGMPCGPEGTAATSNAGAPVVCINTPGGSAWEPLGG